MKLKSSTKKAHQLTLKRLMTDIANQDWDDNAVSTLRQADRFMAYFRETELKTSLDIERDRVVEEISSRAGSVSKAANVVRASEKSSELKNAKTSYANKITSLTTT